jgi:hypothetical protein
MIAGFWKRLICSLKIQRKLSTARHPQTNDQVERVNQVLEQYLLTFTSYQQNDWFDMLAVAEFTYNDTMHSATNSHYFSRTTGSISVPLMLYRQQHHHDTTRLTTGPLI